jgi:hypothetical protein
MRAKINSQVENKTEGRGTGDRNDLQHILALSRAPAVV